MSSNFRDADAKIVQMDFQPSLSGGIVIRVGSTICLLSIGWEHYFVMCLQYLLSYIKHEVV